MTRTVLVLAGLVLLAGCEETQQDETPAGGQPAPAAAPRPATTRETGAPEDPAHELLQAAIKARGGIEALKGASSWKSKWEGTSKGTTHTGTMVFDQGAVRRDFATPDGRQVISVRAPGACWNRIGDNAGRCNPAEEKLCRQGLVVNRAALLWPLAEQPGWTLQAGTRTIGEVTYDTLTASPAQHATRVTLVLHPDDHLTHQTILHDATVGGRTGDIVAEVLETVEACDTIMTARSKVLFDGTPIQVNHNTAIQCGPVDPEVFSYSP